MRMFAVMVFAVACRGSPAISAPPMPPSGEVSVRVFAGRDVSPEAYAPVPDVLVVAHAPDGSVLGTARTDGQGRATFAGFPPGGAVTIREPAATLRTVFDVRPGDVIDVPVVAEAPGPRGWLTGSWKAHPGASGYRFVDGCHQMDLPGRESQRLDVSEACLSPWMGVSAIVYAQDGRGRRIAYATAVDASIRVGGGIQLALG